MSDKQIVKDLCGVVASTLGAMDTIADKRLAKAASLISEVISDNIHIVQDVGGAELPKDNPTNAPAFSSKADYYRSKMVEATKAINQAKDMQSKLKAQRLFSTYKGHLARVESGLDGTSKVTKSRWKSRVGGGINE